MKKIERKITNKNKELLSDETKIALENIIAYMPGHVYWKDKSGKYLGCNDSQARSIGFKHGYEIVGCPDIYGEKFPT